MKSKSSKKIELELTFDSEEIAELENLVDRARRHRVAKNFNVNPLEALIRSSIEEARNG